MQTSFFAFGPDPIFAERLHAGQSQTICLYGTSLSFHLAPILREALQKQFGERAQILNAAMSGQASRSGLAHLEERVLNQAPDVVLLEFAVNDAHSYFHDPQNINAGITLEESRANLEKLIEQIGASLPACEIILQTMNPAWDSPHSDRNCASNRPQLNECYENYREAARAHHLRLQDNHAFWLARLEENPSGWEAWIPDGVHPNPKALREILVPHLLQSWGIAPA